MAELVLGGNIKLIDFEDLEPAFLIVVKKMVGSYVKKLSEKMDVKEFSLKKVKDENFLLEATIIADKEYSASASDKNLFYCINKVFSELLSKF